MKDDSWIAQLPTAQKIFNANVGVGKLQRFSQTGEEGVLRTILAGIGNYNHVLVDIGAGDGFDLSNTRHFIKNEGYSGLLFDIDPGNSHEVYKEMITPLNVCSLLTRHKCPKEFDLLSIDIDGYDFDVIEALCAEYSPRVIVCEINGTIPLGISKKVAYDPNWHYDNNDYYGFSFSACLKLAAQLGYRVVWQNDALNAYLVRRDLLAAPDAAFDVPFKHNPYHAHYPYGDWVAV